MTTFGQPAIPQDNNSLFSHLRAVHKIMKFESSDELFAFVQSLFLAKSANPNSYIKLERAQIQEYVQTRVANRDPEWLLFLSSASDNWKKYAGMK